MPPSLKPAATSDADTLLAVRCWNLCGGMEWAAMPVVFDLIGIRDVEKMVSLMAVIRDRDNKGA